MELNDFMIGPEINKLFKIKVGTLIVEHPVCSEGRIEILIFFARRTNSVAFRSGPDPRFESRGGARLRQPESAQEGHMGPPRPPNITVTSLECREGRRRHAMEQKIHLM